MMMMMMMNFLIFCIILNYKLFNFSPQSSCFYIIYTHHNNMDCKKFRSEVSFHSVHILIFWAKVMLVGLSGRHMLLNNS